MQSEWQCAVVQPEQWHDLLSCVEQSFYSGSDSSLRESHTHLDARLSLTLTHEEQLAGGGFAMPFDMTLPGLKKAPVAGLLGVGIAPSFHGLGGLNTLICEHILRAHAAGYWASSLMASDYGIYSRYGFGESTRMHHFFGPTPELGLNEHARALAATQRIDFPMAPYDMLIETMCEWGKRWAEASPGAFSRNAYFWSQVLSAKRNWQGGGVHLALSYDKESPTRIDGHATFRMLPPSDGDTMVEGWDIDIIELTALSLEAELALWQALVNRPWVRTLSWRNAPLRPRLHWHLHNPRALRIKEHSDWTWLRPINASALLRSRSYEVDGRCVLSLHDPLLAHNCGTYSLTHQQGKITLEHCDERPDCLLDMSTLGNLLLGGISLSELVEAGMVQWHSSQAVTRLFDCTRAPVQWNRF